MSKSISRFFIERPILAWVIGILIMLVGVLSITRLPVSLYPNIASPSIEIDASYPGASAKTVEDSVTQIIEQNMTGLDGVIYIASTSDGLGNVSIVLTFASGTNPDTAQVQVQNKLQQATPLLPQIVQQQGISVSKSNTANQMVVAFISTDGHMSAGDISDYVSSNIVDPLSRVKGVGNVAQFGSAHAMRIWLDADKLNTYALTPADVTAAINAQNAQVSLGQLGGLPSVHGQQLNATVTALGWLNTAEQFRNIVIRSTSNGGTLRLGDVARVELGQADYSTSARFNGKPAAGLGITLATGANELEMEKGVKSLLEKLQTRFPAGVKVMIPYDTAPYVRLSIEGVIRTLCEAIFLVFVVMFLFLQNLRATLIPTIAVPVVVLGTFTVLAMTGLSMNMLTMFAIVLAIGLLVDDAIVVVENVERLMSEEGVTPVEATRRSMDQLTSALVGIASVLSAVFIPMAFTHGSVGIIYRQFSITIVSAMILSVFVAIVLTPALCTTLLKPVGTGGRHVERGFFRWFNRTFDRISQRCLGIVAHILARPVRYLVIYLALAGIMVLLFYRLPTAFLPNEDQGYLFTLVQTPVGATQERTINALSQTEKYFLEQEKDAVVNVFTIAGFSFAGGGQNSGFGFIELKDWSERKSAQLGAAAIQDRASAALANIKDAQVIAFAPPPVLELGDSAGFDFYLQDSLGQGHDALTAARDQFLALAAKDPLLANVRPNGQDDTPQFHLDIDPQKATSLGLSMSDVNDTLAVAWGGRYIDDFVDQGRVKRVIIQADAPFRMAPEDFGRWYVRNSDGNMVSVASFANARWTYGSPRLERYNGSSAMEINGEAAPGASTGQAMKEIEKLVAQLPPGFSAEFTGQSYDEREAGAQTPMLYTLSLIVVFLWLAALYESWSIPTAILLAVPLGVVGAVLMTWARGMESDIYFQVAMLTTMGLTSKNAILIVEFAKENLERGMSLLDATLQAVRGRLRPILMTSLAFGFGVLPLAIANGAGGGAQRAIGTGVFGGMLAGTFLGIFFIPLFFVVVQRKFHGLPEAPSRSQKQTATSDGEGSPHGR
jgi:multidrug efflux pump